MEFLEASIIINIERDLDQSLVHGMYSSINFRSSHCGATETNQIRNHEVSGSILGLAQWVKDLVLP